MDLFIQYAIVAAEQAMRQIAIRYGAREINPTTTSACFSGSQAAGEAYRMIRHGCLDAVIVGGSEATLTTLGVGGFIATRALLTRNRGPEAANRPFDAERDGFVMSEGAAALILEERRAALGRGANILAEIAGYGADSDADRMTSPSLGGPGAAARWMQLGREDGDLDSREVDYINAQGTSTPQGDVAETQAIRLVFGERSARIAVSSTKSMTGHAQGAAGAIESIYTVLAVERGILRRRSTTNVPIIAAISIT